MFLIPFFLFILCIPIFFFFFFFFLLLLLLLWLLLLFNYKFFILVVTGDLHWSQNDCMFLQLSRILVGTLFDFSHAVVLIVSIFQISRPLFSFSGFFFWLFLMLGVTITFIFHNFFSSLTRYLFSFLFSFIFTLWSTEMVASTTWQFFSFCLLKLPLDFQLSSGYLLLSPNLRKCVSFSNSGLYKYHLSVWSKLSLTQSAGAEEYANCTSAEG